MRFDDLVDKGDVVRKTDGKISLVRAKFSIVAANVVAAGKK
jgi:hypothetical protein